ncbi:MAG: hypothetical protein KF684_08115 [Phycisphaeraceae bacterium]|nr:hypothetical protein [Phycisphaeraceae bacterium]
MRIALMLLLQAVSIAAMTAIGVGIVLSVSNGSPNPALIGAMGVNSVALVVIAWKLRGVGSKRRAGRD